MKAASLPRAVIADRGRASDRATYSATPGAWPVALLGVPFDPVTGGEAVARLVAAVLSHMDFRAVVAPWTTVLRCRRDPRLHAGLLEADLVLAGSPTMTWVARRLGGALPRPTPALEFARTVASAAASRRWRVFILGDTPEVVVSANSAFTNGSPATALTALYAPAQPGNYDGDELSARLAGFRPDLVLALSGSPTLDLWLARRPAALAGIAVLQLPPQPFQRRPSPASRCQWRDVATIVRRLWQQSWSRHRTPTSAAVHRSTQRWIDVDAGPVLTRAVLDRQPGLWIAPGLRENHAAFSLSRVTAIDATGIALLARCQAAARRYGRQFALVAPSPAVRAALADAGLLPLSTVVSSRDDAHRLAPSTEPEAGVTRSLAWCGEILAANVEDVWQMTSDYVRTFSAQGATLVFIDLARLRLLDTAGAALMLRVKRWGRSLRTEILFTHAPPHVATVLRLTSADLLVLEGAQ